MNLKESTKIGKEKRLVMLRIKRKNGAVLIKQDMTGKTIKELAEYLNTTEESLQLEMEFNNEMRRL